MLNESASASATKQPPPPPPPRLHTHTHTPQTSFERPGDRATPYDATSDRLSSYPPSSHGTLDSSRSQTGSYFTQHSPQQHSASTPSAGAPSAYIQSPGSHPHGQIYTPREHGSVSTPTQYPHPPPPPYAQRSPSSAGLTHPPTTPGSAQYHPGYVNQTNGAPPGVRQMSPPQAAFTHQTPVTPLGPPAAYRRPSPQAQRPTSQGYDHFRRSSISSVGSAQSRDYPIHHMQPEPATGRMGSVHRALLGEEERQRERERSYESVSPKTIPRPTPSRQSTSHSQSQEPPPTFDSRPPPPTSSLSSSTPSRKSRNRSMEDHPNGVASQRSTRLDEMPQPTPPPPAAATTPSKPETPQSAHSSVPPQPSPHVPTQTLKRSNSMLSNPPASIMPPRKRPRRDDVPVFAQSARRGKPIRFIEGGAPPRNTNHAPVVKLEPSTAPIPATNGQRATSVPAPVEDPFDPKFDPTITSQLPYDDIVRQICDFVAIHLVHATEPVPGSFFEVEAKLGAIIDPDTNHRISLPIMTEAIVDKKRMHGIRFASTMDVVSLVFSQ
jgi:hypothetical protein